MQREDLDSEDENLFKVEVEDEEPPKQESIQKKKSGKSIRSEAQKKAFEIARAKRIENGKIAREKVAEIKEKARKMEFIKEKLNKPSVAAAPSASAEESDEEIVVVRKKPKRKPKKIIYESEDDEDEDEVIAKPKKSSRPAANAAIMASQTPTLQQSFKLKFI